RLHGPNQEIVDELKRLALRYGILTEYTSYLVQEPLMAYGGGRGGIPLPTTVAPAPRDQAGAGAVQRAEAERKLSGAVALDAVVVGGSMSDSAVIFDRDELHPRKRLGARVFAWRDGAWTDVAHGDSLR